MEKTIRLRWRLSKASQNEMLCTRLSEQLHLLLRIGIYPSSTARGLVPALYLQDCYKTDLEKLF